MATEEGDPATHEKFVSHASGANGAAQILRCPTCRSLLPAELSHGLCPICLLESWQDTIGDEGNHAGTLSDLGSGDSTANGQGSSVPQPLPDATLPKKIGPYLVLTLLGEGGMGRVYLAQQMEPVRRKVALKVIRRSVGDDEIMARFDVEKQTLALMEHPNIARVFDAGTDEETQLPYFVMEFIDGVPITTFCQRAYSSIKDRLNLFLEICDGILHAHQKGVIHRDLKPANILIEKKNGKPLVRIIDFGIAKAVRSNLVDTLYTQLGQLIGTPAYMSPEQADLSLNEVDTRSDIFSLGIILYELLTWTTPVSARELQKVGVEKMLDLIKNFDPPSPSLRAKELLLQQQRLTASRTSLTHKVPQQLRGDLDWIVMKAISKEPERRYQTVAAFAEDIRRFQANEPVSAGPPSSLYKLRKFSKRNRTGVIAASAVTISILLGLGASFWQAGIAKEKALEAQRNAELATNALLEAEAKAREAEKQAQMAREADRKSREQANLTVQAKLEAENQADLARRAKQEAESQATLAKQSEQKAIAQSNLARQAEKEKQTVMTMREEGTALYLRAEISHRDFDDFAALFQAARAISFGNYGVGETYPPLLTRELTPETFEKVLKLIDRSSIHPPLCFSSNKLSLFPSRFLDRTLCYDHSKHTLAYWGRDLHPLDSLHLKKVIEQIPWEEEEYEEGHRVFAASADLGYLACSFVNYESESDYGIKIFDLHNDALPRTLELQFDSDSHLAEKVLYIQWSPNGKLIGALTGRGKGPFFYVDEIVVWETANGRVVYEGSADSLKFSWGADSTALAVGEANKIRVLDSKDWSVRSSFECETPTEIESSFRPANEPSFSPCGKYLAVTSENRVTIYDAVAMTLLHNLKLGPLPQAFQNEGSFKSPNNPLTSDVASWDPSGRYLATRGVVVDVVSGEIVASPGLPSKAWLPDGSMLLSDNALIPLRLPLSGDRKYSEAFRRDEILGAMRRDVSSGIVTIDTKEGSVFWQPTNSEPLRDGIALDQIPVETWLSISCDSSLEESDRLLRLFNCLARSGNWDGADHIKNEASRLKESIPSRESAFWEYSIDKLVSEVFGAVSGADLALASELVERGDRLFSGYPYWENPMTSMLKMWQPPVLSSDSKNWETDWEEGVTFSSQGGYESAYPDILSAFAVITGGGKLDLSLLTSSELWSLMIRYALSNSPRTASLRLKSDAVASETIELLLSRAEKRKTMSRLRGLHVEALSAGNWDAAVLFFDHLDQQAVNAVWAEGYEFLEDSKARDRWGLRLVADLTRAAIQAQQKGDANRRDELLAIGERCFHRDPCWTPWGQISVCLLGSHTPEMALAAVAVLEAWTKETLPLPGEKFGFADPSVIEKLIGFLSASSDPKQRAKGDKLRKYLESEHSKRPE